MTELKLILEQQRTIDSAVTLIHRMCRDLTDVSGPHKSRSEQLDKLKTPRIGNVVGVFGPRGAGKTTCVTHIIRRLSVESPPTSDLVDVEKHKWRLVRHPLDLSQMPNDTAQGLAVIEWLHRKAAGEPQNRRSDDPCEQSFERVRRAFMLRTEETRKLVRSVSLSLDDFSRRSSQRLDSQMELPNLVSQWLDGECDRHKCAGLIVVVDDADLCRAEGQESLVWSLLDELHQSRLLVVMVADYDRLERNMTEQQGKRLDGRTAAELWEKAIPESHRFALQPWIPGVCDRFSSNLTGDNRAFSDRVRALDLRALARSIPYLLPTAPRGLRTTHEVLSDFELLETKEQTKDQKKEQSQALLIKLVRAASHGALANAIVSGTSRWLERARWDGRTVETKPVQNVQSDAAMRWRRMAYDASVGTSDAEHAAIRGLVPDNPEDLGLVGLSETMQSRWTEAFMDLELERHDADAMSPRQLINAHAALRWISKQLTPTVELSRLRAAEYLARSTNTHRVELMWMEWRQLDDEGESGEAPRRVGYRLGLRSLLKYSGGRRNLLDAAVAEALIVDQREDRDSPGRDPIMPSNVRDMIRLMTAMNRVNWQALATSRIYRSPGGMVRLAAGLIWMSYLYAIEQLDVGVVPEIPDQWRRGYLRWDDATIDEHFRLLVNHEPLKVTDDLKNGQAGPLCEAFENYRKDECFLGLVPEVDE